MKKNLDFTSVSVILIDMRIEKDDLHIDDNVGSKKAMEASMLAIREILIEPAIEEDRLSENEEMLMGTIGLALKMIALKAQAYEDIYEKGILPKNSQN